MRFFPFLDWRKILRWYYTRRYARALGVAPAQVDISGPCIIHGGGRFVVGKNVAIRSTARLPVELYCARGATSTFADGCFLNQGVHIACGQEILVGGKCLIADQVLIMDSDFHGVGDVPSQSTPVRIERGAWIGARAIILKGVTIGEGAVIGAGAVVAHSVPPRSLAVGNPANVVREW
jgi:acetyltransferase-like isoleucine patch superfamily enzyme